MNKKNVVAIFKIFKENCANPKTELKYGNGFQLLVAVILSAQSQDKVVNQVTEQLFKKVNSPADMMNISLAELVEYIKKLGLFRTKAANIKKTSQILEEKFNGQVPEHRKELETLPGVGKKTAAVIVNSLYNQLAIAVDTHVFRVSNRLGLVSTTKAEKTEDELVKVIPKWGLLNAHHWLVLHGRYVCVARKPKCDDCYLSEYCEYRIANIKANKLIKNRP
ncbi:MAG: endonuclease III [SAR324 cluster bacterium]|nr:endonuclease III [SAR324 cluster bacterium]